MVVAIGDDFQVIQQEIQMMRECQHQNIVAYYGSYLRYCFHTFTCMVAWCSGNALCLINEVVFHQTGLVLRSVSACGQVNHLNM